MFRGLIHEETWRLRLLYGMMIALFAGLTVVLWDMQVRHRAQYQSDLMRQSLRRVRLPGNRGRIYDRSGHCVADNRASYNLVLYLEELRQPGRWDRTIDYVDRLLDRLSSTLELPRQVSKEDIRTHVRRRLPLPFVAWRDVDEIALARCVELASGEPGLDVQADPVRTYPFGDLACHLIGYVGRAGPEDLAAETEEFYHYYLPEMIGRSGLEKVFDGFLRGEPGGRLVRVDVSGFRHGDLAIREPHGGLSLKLALDVRIQEVVEKVLKGVVGAAVVVDPRNGDVLALASSPGYDLNAFSPSIGAELWEQMRTDPAKPLMNRALAGTYAPGSTFKPVVALAALQNGKATPETIFSCPGYFVLGTARFNCWLARGHGPLNMEGALEHSCNVYFFRLGLQTGWDPIYHMAAALGFGQKTGIAADFELPGLLPNNAWKRRVQGDSWRDGDTCNASIGQGALLVTPIQMAMYVAAIANGGHLYRPRIATDLLNDEGRPVRTFPPSQTASLHFEPRHLRAVREGMRKVVMSPQGTGRLAKIPNVEVAGKTGTAEYGRKQEGKKIGWMIAFAPYERPTVALVVMVENVVSGGATVAPLVQSILTAIFSRPTMEGEG